MNQTGDRRHRGEGELVGSGSRSLVGRPDTEETSPCRSRKVVGRLCRPRSHVAEDALQRVAQVAGAGEVARQALAEAVLRLANVDQSVLTDAQSGSTQERPGRVGGEGRRRKSRARPPNCGGWPPSRWAPGCTTEPSPVSPGAPPLRPAPELGWLHRTERPWPRGAASGCASFFESIHRGGGAGSRQAGAFAWGTARKERPPRRGATGREVVAHDLPHARTEAMIQHRAVASRRRRSVGRWSSSSWATSMPPAVPRYARPTRIGRRGEARRCQRSAPFWLS